MANRATYPEQQISLKVDYFATQMCTNGHADPYRAPKDLQNLALLFPPDIPRHLDEIEDCIASKQPYDHAAKHLSFEWHEAQTTLSHAPVDGTHAHSFKEEVSY